MITRKQQQPTPKSSQSGFTIIESLMAIIVVTILMIGISPMIALSVATRVQARRVELGTQAARAYVDGVRGGTITQPERIVAITELSTSGSNTTYTSKRDQFSDVPAPTSLPNCDSPNTNGGYCENAANTSLYCVDLDQDSKCTSSSNQDLIVQAFRGVYETTPGDPTTRVNNSSLLGVRVYRADAFQDNTPLKRTSGGSGQSSTFSGGMGDSKAPLIEMTTEIANGATYQDLCQRFGKKELDPDNPNRYKLSNNCN